MQSLLQEMVTLVQLLGWCITLSHIDREANHCTDAMAVHSLANDFSLNILELSFSILYSLLNFGGRWGLFLSI